MGGKTEKGESMEWTTQNTKIFIDIIYDRVKKGQLQGSTFKKTIWEEINIELQKTSGAPLPDGVERLKGKFNRLRLQHREFSTLISRTGVTWDPEANKVNSPEEVWEEMYKKGKFYKQFKKHGFEHDYYILGEIFNSSTATGKLSQASTQEPPNSDEEREIEEDFLSKGVHIDSKVIDVDGEDLQEVSKRRKVTGTSSEGRRKEAKNSRLDVLESAVTKWSNAMDARADRYKNEVDSSADACIKLLDSMDGISPKVFSIAVEKFTNKDLRKMFIAMSSIRKMDWLASLE
ncbi:uncharacterized protein At2g29880-like [Lotus japonicus]|uniref:uncharacterized protein At2g29880-like n=1 Tax=Lotus japonicus TaxID=34305 RepID=UPI00258E688A|nr:uncharacterized protein At2g29880-like [Lotus japonicus]XP_057456974.1 uncharacterized protein At2g29880-like [Lotus japonicus]